ncbi:unnamed protein product [Rotaria sp. Silwood1]|nr:unnamed protein product [Rotaria sp. Silwood1]CAF0921784.1 unnamed protein product [Rotaria sp. Silwood1]CAF0947905.1 unnamed protein product [Rotaria sp. Silwood1]CAF3376550.1 unnamed protein product [Rotaria sp. Silwood1]CAF3399975.1 unnamed protein product [Rotaria sp. Silwood1]
MSSSVNSPKTSNSFNIPILRGSKYSPSIEKSSQHHRTTFHLSNIFQTLTKFSRNIRTTNSFIRSTSTTSNDQQNKLTRRSFTKQDTLSTSINRPSSCFILLSPSKHVQETCLFFQKPTNTDNSPKLNSISSFNKIKRVSSFLLPLKRRQSLSLNHSLHERSFKAKESTKRRSRLLNYSIFKHKNSLSINYTLLLGTFGYKKHENSIQLIQKSFFLFDIIQIDLILQIRLNNSLHNNYQSILYDIPHWPFIQKNKSFYGILLEQQILVLFQPKLFENNLYHQKHNYYDFIYIPFPQIKYKENHFIHIGYDCLAPTTIRIPLTWISKIDFDDYQISSKDIE